MTEQRLPAWADPSVSPARLDPQGVSRRQLLRRAGLFGAALAAGPLAAPAAARGRGLGGDDPRLAYLVGDHHVHSVYSHDAKYTFSQLARAGARYGLDWMVFNEHSNFGHAAFGARSEHQEILRARAENPRQLIFQGLEWYIPAAEHATVFAAPGPHETDLLTRFELAYDGKLLGYTEGAPPIRTRRATRHTRSRPSGGSPSSAAPDTSTTYSSWPTTRCAWASTPRTRCAAGGTRHPRS